MYRASSGVGSLILAIVAIVAETMWNISMPPKSVHRFPYLYWYSWTFSRPGWRLKYFGEDDLIDQAQPTGRCRYDSPLWFRRSGTDPLFPNRARTRWPHPAWMGHRGEIAFAEGRAGDAQSWVMSVSGSLSSTRVLSSQRLPQMLFFLPRFSPKYSFFLFCEGGRRRSVFVV